MKKLFFIIAGFLCILFIYAITYGIFMVKEVKSFLDPKYSRIVKVYDWNKKEHSFVLGPKNPYYVSWKNINTYVKWAVILSEDAKFYKHSGVDYEAMKLAMKKNLEVGKYVRGGSTITQQLAKNVFLSREKTLSRKLKELIIAFIMENNLSKTRILELYLNVVELGPLVYGIGHGSSFYFGKHPSSLNPLEAAMLAALLPGPKVFNPYRNLDKVEKRAKNILRRMMEVKIITPEDYERYVSSSLVVGMEKKIEVRLKEEKNVFNNNSSVVIFSNHTTAN